MQPLDLITFDTAQLELRADEASQRLWLAANGDAVSLHYFPGPPPIRADLGFVDQVRAFWRQTTADAGTFFWLWRLTLQQIGRVVKGSGEPGKVTKWMVV